MSSQRKGLLLKNLIAVILLLFYSCSPVAKDESLNGFWGCKIPMTSLVFDGTSIIVSDMIGSETNTTFEKKGDKILLATGDVLTLINDSTILFPITIPQFFTKMDCECSKGKVYERKNKTADLPKQ